MFCTSDVLRYPCIVHLTRDRSGDVSIYIGEYHSNIYYAIDSYDATVKRIWKDFIKVSTCLN